MSERFFKEGEKILIKDILYEVQFRVIEPIQKDGILSNKKLKKKKKFFYKQLYDIWRGNEIIGEVDKLDDDDIYEYPYAVAYLLYCCPMQLVAVIKEPRKIHEYWEMYLDEFPEIKFDGNIHRFYKAVKKGKRK